MTSIVMQYGGAINKYIGDNMMAFWNAPYTQEDHAWLATQAALGMLEAIHKLNETGQFTAPVQFGIGINTGPVVVGNVGSQRRLEYTPIGDTVNVAARLEALNKELGTYTLISRDVYTQLPEELANQLYERGEQQIKGREQSVSVYTLKETKAKLSVVSG